MDVILARRQSRREYTRGRADRPVTLVLCVWVVVLARVEAGELDKAEEVLSVVLPADEYATLPLYPGEEALDEPAPLVTA